MQYSGSSRRQHAMLWETPHSCPQQQPRQPTPPVKLHTKAARATGLITEPYRDAWADCSSLTSKAAKHSGSCATAQVNCQGRDRASFVAVIMCRSQAL